MLRAQTTWAHRTIKGRIARLYTEPTGDFRLCLADSNTGHFEVLSFDKDEEAAAESTAEVFCELNKPEEWTAPRVYCTCGACAFCMIGQAGHKPNRTCESSGRVCVNRYCNERDRCMFNGQARG